MEAIVSRDEMHSYIDSLTDRSLAALRPILTILAETDVTGDENAMIEESLAEYRNDPASVKPWKKIRRG